MNYQPNEILTVCPVFNESHHLENLIKEITNTEFLGDFLFINSGSTDDSEKLIKESGLQYKNLEINEGIGNVIMEAIKYANSRDYKVLCLIAGNSKMRPKYINKILNPIINGDYDFVQGSRYLNFGDTTNMPLFRKIVIPITSKLFSFLYRKRMTDATCGFRSFKLSLINSASYDIYANWLKKYAFEPYFYSNVLLDKNVKSIEVPITMDYPNRKNKKKYTKIKPILDYPALFLPYILALVNPKKFKDFNSTDKNQNY